MLIRLGSPTAGVNMFEIVVATGLGAAGLLAFVGFKYQASRQEATRVKMKAQRQAARPRSAEPVEAASRPAVKLKAQFGRR